MDNQPPVEDHNEPEYEIQPAVPSINSDYSRSVELRTVEDVMEDSYLRYSMSVIVARALPDVRDGLKPVHRRILYAMNVNGWRSNASTVKSARVTGDVMGKYHPHGNVAIYDAMARMAQPWSMRYVLIQAKVTSARWMVTRRQPNVILKPKWLV